MKKEEITSEHVLEICKLYKLHLGGHLIDEYIENRFSEFGNGELDKLVRELKEKGTTIMYRIGSKYTPHTKFGFESHWQTEDIFPDVYLNFDPKNKQGKIYQEAERTVEEFKRRAMEYLVQCSTKIS